MAGDVIECRAWGAFAVAKSPHAEHGDRGEEGATVHGKLGMQGGVGRRDEGDMGNGRDTGRNGRGGCNNR